ncbi:MAG TPA: SDR family oxidoreductase [Candidatus Fraserbacteria bacterium]|nr:SDR family oxidoreductase [Candidatus Fraserbacteria bacterium]
MSHYLVSGAAGFIGSHLTARLLELGKSVRALDNFSTGKRVNLAGCRGHGSFELLTGDLRDLETARQAVAGIDIVLHQAAISSVPRSVADPLSSHQANATGTLNLLIAARDAGVRKLVYASSSSIYGPTSELPQRETMPPNPVSPYALSKFAGERYCQLFSQLYELPTVALRYFNVFGPRQDPASQYAAVIPRFIIALLSGRPPVIYGDGEQTRDFTYIANVVEANLLAAQAEISGEVLNIACGEPVSLNALLAQLEALLSIEITPEYTQSRPGDLRRSQADIAKARDLIGYRPQVGFAEGLRRTLEYFQREMKR